MEPLIGIHHVTAITSSAEKIYDFFTDVLGLRLVKKTVNQDDIGTYHLFFADAVGSPGTDMTFFDFAGIAPAKKGTDELSRTGFRVPDDAALAYWVRRFDHFKVRHEGVKSVLGRNMLFFEDFDHQAYALVSDTGVRGVAAGMPWEEASVPAPFAITGLGPMFMRVRDLERMGKVLLETMGMQERLVEAPYTLYEMGEGGNGASVIVEEDRTGLRGTQGYGAVHHVAFRVRDREAIDAWTKRLQAVGAPNSGFVERFYFQSLYTRLYPGILFEFATEGPGFTDDEETLETLGETLALPPKLRPHRAAIEAEVRPIDTVRHNKTAEKMWFGCDTTSKR
ncbi:MAG: ring-cleaving dioxygenase [Acholeplasmatales bacterium]|nr:MAG: ring-cleaving dioxygenase [Acholeplasmatales bacterium]